MNQDLSLAPGSRTPIIEGLPPASFVHQQEPSVHVRDLWKIVHRRRALLLYVTLAFFLLGALYCAFVPKLYKAEARLQVLKQNSTAFLGDPAQASASAAADALDFNLAAQTQIEVIKSRNIALQVIATLHLDRDPDYQLRNNPEENAKPLAQSPKHLDYALTRFAKRLNATTVSGTRLLSISFLDRNPKRAQQIVSEVTSSFVAYNSQVQFNTSSDATKLLAADLDEMKAQVDRAQAKVVQLQQQSGIYGPDEVNNATNAKLEQLNAQLTLAQSQLTLKQSIYQLAKTRSPEVLSGMIGATGTGANTTNAPLQMLRQQQAEAAATYAELNERYGSQYPKVQQLRERLQAIDTSTTSEVNRLVGQAAAEYKVASDTESGARRAFNDQKVLASRLNHDALLYTSAKHEADASRSLYEELQKRLKEADLLASLHSTNLNVLDPAIVPVELAQPRWVLTLAAALTAGFFFGLVLIFAKDVMDDSVHDPQKLEDFCGLPVLALLPPADRALTKQTISLLRRAIGTADWPYQIVSGAPRSVVAESFRSLRGAILAQLSVSGGKSLAVTSTFEAEGKSFTAVNLATSFAQSGRKVLLIDGDLRRRSLSLALGIHDLSGLREVVDSMPWQNAVVAARDTPGLYMLSAGNPSDSPADIMASAALSTTLRKLRSSFDLVLIDTPSTLDVADNISIAAAVDAIIVVAKSGVTQQHALTHTLRTLHRAHARILGVVLNGIDFQSSDYLFYCGRRSAGYERYAAVTPAAVQYIKPQRAAIASVVTLLCLFMAQANAQQYASPDTTATTPTLINRAAAEANSGQTVLLGPGDLLSITTFDAPELTQDVRVGSDGNVHLLLLGDVPAGGQPADQLANHIEILLRDRQLIKKPHVSVTIKEFTTQGVTIEGEVRKPGVYPVFSDRSLLDVIALAEGTTPNADNHVTIHHKTTGKIDEVILSQDNGRTLVKNDVRVQPGDTIVVPRAGYAYVLGDVLHPGGYIMHDNGSMTVLGAISEAQGTGHTASLKHVLLLRKTDGQTQTIPIQLKAIQRGKEPDPSLQAGDIVFVPPSGVKTFEQDTAGIFASVSGAALYSVK